MFGKCFFFLIMFDILFLKIVEDEGMVGIVDVIVVGELGIFVFE